MKVKIDVFDLLPPEAIAAVDKCAYDFLASQGFDISDAKDSAGARDKLARKLKRKCATLYYHGATDSETGGIRVWFTLFVRGKKRACSTILDFLPNKGVKIDEEKDAENQA